MLTDLATAGIVFVTLSILFVQEPEYIILLIAILSSLLPDIDMFIYGIRRKINKFPSHHIIHFPLILIPIVVYIGFMFGNVYIATVIGLCIFGHFFHDSISTTGIKWLYPFKNTYYVLSHKGIVSLSESGWRKKILEENSHEIHLSFLDILISRANKDSVSFHNPLKKAYILMSLLVTTLFFIFY